MHGWGHAVARLVEPLRYKPEDRGFDYGWCHFYWHNPSSRTTALGSSQTITAMSTRTIPWGLIILPPSCADGLEIWELQPPGTLCVCNRPVQRLIYLFLYTAWTHFHTFFVDPISTRKLLLKSCAAIFMAYTANAVRCLNAREDGDKVH